MLAGLGAGGVWGAAFIRERARPPMVEKAAELAAKGKQGQAKAEGQSRRGGVSRAGGVKAGAQGGWE